MRWAGGWTAKIITAGFGTYLGSKMINLADDWSSREVNKEKIKVQHQIDKEKIQLEKEELKLQKQAIKIDQKR